MSSPDFFVHDKALVEPGVEIGARTRIWAFAHILPGVKIGEGCNVCDHTLIENKVSLGDRVTIKSGVYIWSGVTVEDDVFVGPCVAFTNDLKPRSKQYPEEFLPTLLKKGSSIGANATILPGITIGEYALIGAGSVVTKSVPDFALAYGNPAEIRGWICSCGQILKFDSVETQCICGLKYIMHGNRMVVLKTT